MAAGHDEKTTYPAEENMAGSKPTEAELELQFIYEPGSKLLTLKMVIQPLVGNP